MNKSISNLSHESISFQEPNVCPICLHAIEPVHLYNYLSNLGNGNWHFSVFFKCPHCFKTFIAIYSAYKHPVTEEFFVDSNCLLAPKTHKPEVYSEVITDNYTSFVNIYNQALQAENIGLNEIAGVGYRKALEFLIKDFLINHEGKEQEKVKPTALGVCINTMIDNPQLKSVASRATWLGNDQTHYEQKYTDKDISDLKRLIKLSVNWIEMIYLTEEAEQMEQK